MDVECELGALTCRILMWPNKRIEDKDRGYKLIENSGLLTLILLSIFGHYIKDNLKLGENVVVQKNSNYIFRFYHIDYA